MRKSSLTAAAPVLSLAVFLTAAAPAALAQDNEQPAITEEILKARADYEESVRAQIPAAEKLRQDFDQFCQNMNEELQVLRDQGLPIYAAIYEPEPPAPGTPERTNTTSLRCGFYILKEMLPPGQTADTITLDVLDLANMVRKEKNRLFYLANSFEADGPEEGRKRIIEGLATTLLTPDDLALLDPPAPETPQPETNDLN